MSVHDLTTVDWFCLLLACSGVALWALSFILTRKIERIADDMRRGSAIIERRLYLKQIKGRKV